MSPPRDNNFDALRLMGAAAVVLGHSFILVGAAPHALLGQSVSTLGVMVFFSISGYLITRSWINDPHPLRFAMRRARRIFPALIVVVLTCILVIGAALTPLPLAEYLTHPQTIRFLGNAVLYVAYTLPLVFADNIYPHAVNGSLWTLPVEVALYAMTPAFVLLGRFRLALVALLGLAIWLAVHAKHAQPAPFVIAGTEFWTAGMLAPFFVAGALTAQARLERWLSPLVGLVLLAALQLAPLEPSERSALLPLVLPYATLAIGLGSWPVLRSAGRFGDASYGIYLWSFPVQQVFVHVIGAAGGGWGNFALAMPTSLVLGLLSWHLVEKHALGARTHKRPAPPGGLSAVNV